MPLNVIYCFNHSQMYSVFVFHLHIQTSLSADENSEPCGFLIVLIPVQVFEHRTSGFGASSNRHELKLQVKDLIFCFSYRTGGEDVGDCGHYLWGLLASPPCLHADPRLPSIPSEWQTGTRPISWCPLAGHVQ